MSALVLLLGCRKPIADAIEAAPSIGVTTDAATEHLSLADGSAEGGSADGGADAVADAGPPPIDAGPLVEDTSGFEKALPLAPLAVELLPLDQRKRADRKPGPARVARTAGGDLATFGVVTNEIDGAPITRQWWTRKKPTPLAKPGLSYALYEARMTAAPAASLLVLEDAARAPIAIRAVAVALDVKEVALFDDGPAFFLRTLDGPSGIDDPITLHVIALVDGELREVAKVPVGFRDVEPCPTGPMSTLGPPGTVVVATTGAAPVLHVKESVDCDSPAKVSAGCAGLERDWTWDPARRAFAPKGAGTKVTLSSKRSRGC